MMKPKANLSDFQAGEKIFRVTDRVTVDQPVSDMLCSNFIELGFGFQVEGMWSEMLFNRSFEKIPQLTPATYDWFGGLHLPARTGGGRSGTTLSTNTTAGTPALPRMCPRRWRRTAPTWWSTPPSTP